MAMVAGEMAEAILESGMNDLSEEDTAEDANKLFGDAILGYIRDNAEITYSWAGATMPGTPPAPDTATSFNASLTGGLPVIEPPCGDDAEEAFGALFNQIADAVKGFTIQPESGFFVSGLALNPGAAISVLSLQDAAEGGGRERVMQVLCDHIIDSIKRGFLNPIPVLGGTHGQYLNGTAIMTGIE